jgi:branched-chain amino acid transport system permease protein
METFIQLLVSGLLMGVSYGVLAAGLALIFGVVKIVNFAHAAFAVLAMYFPAFWFLEWWGIDPFISSIIALPIFFIVGYATQRMIIDKVIGTPAAEMSTLIVTMGLSLLIENGILIGWSGAPRIINLPYTLGSFKVGNILLNQAQTYSFILSLVLIAALFVFLNKTMLGKAIRAVADDPESCAYMGINLRFAYCLAFGVGIAITASGGCLIATYRPFNPFYAETIIVIIFACCILGGVRSVQGALIGGIIIGCIQMLSTMVVAVALQNVAVFLLFVLFLYLKPEGLLGKKGRVV